MRKPWLKNLWLSLVWVALAAAHAQPARAEDPPARNQWDFSTTEGRAAFFAAMLNEDPDLVSRNLTFKRDPWEILPQIEAVLKALPAPNPKFGMRTGTLIESLPASVTIVYSDAAMDSVRKTFLKDLQSLGDLKELQPLPEELKSRKGDMRSLRSFVRLIPLIYDANGKPLFTADERAASVKTRIEKLDHSELDNLYRDLLPNHQMHHIQEAVHSLETDALRERLAYGLSKIDPERVLRPIAEELEALKDDAKAYKTMVQLAPLLYGEDGLPVDAPGERVAQATARVQALTFKNWETKLKAQTRLLTTPPALHEIHDDTTTSQAVQSTHNFVRSDVSAAITPTKKPMEGANVKAASGPVLRLQEVPPEVGVFRGCYGGDCSAFSVPHYSFAEGVRTFFIRREGSPQPIGYVLMKDVDMGGKKVPYVITVNGKISTPMASEIIRMLAAEAKSETVLLPDFNHSSNKYLVNTDDIRNAYNGFSVVRNQSIAMGSSWNAIDKLIGPQSGAYSNYYLESNVAKVRVVKVPQDATAPQVLVTKEAPLPYEARDIKKMPPLERALVASRVATKDPQLKALFNVSDAQMALAQRISNFDVSKPLTAAEMRQGETEFNLSWKDWSKLPKDLLLTTLLELTPDDRTALKAYPGDSVLDKLGKDLAKTLDPEKLEQYGKTLELIFKIPTGLRSPALVTRLDAEFEKLLSELDRGLSVPSPSAKSLSRILYVLKLVMDSPQREAEVRKVLSARPTFLIPDSEEFSGYLIKIAQDFIGTSSLNEADALARRKLLNEIRTRGARFAQLNVLKNYFSDPNSVADESFAKEFLAKSEAIRRSMDIDILNKDYDANLSYSAKAEFTALFQSLQADPFMARTLTSYGWNNSTYTLENLRAAQKIRQDVELTGHKALLDKIDMPHFWQFKEIPAWVVPQENGKWTIPEAREIFLRDGIRLAPKPFLVSFLKAVFAAKTSAPVTTKLVEAIDQSVWDHPLLDPEIVNLIVSNQGDSTGSTKFADAVVAALDKMPQDQIRVCVGASCLTNNSSTPIRTEMLKQIAAGNVGHFLLRDRQTIEILLAPNSKARPGTISLVFENPALTLRFLDKLFELAHADPMSVAQTVTSKSHYNYPAFGPQAGEGLKRTAAAGPVHGDLVMSSTARGGSSNHVGVIVDVDPETGRMITAEGNKGNRAYLTRNHTVGSFHAFGHITPRLLRKNFPNQGLASLN